MAGEIDIGAAATDRDYYLAHLITHISKVNPANESGEIVTVQFYLENDVTVSKVGMFYLTGTNQLKCRSAHSFGALIPGYHSYTVSLDVVAGDYIGWYSAGSSLKKDISGAGYWKISGDYCDVGDEVVYAPTDARTISLYGIGDSVPPLPELVPVADGDLIGVGVIRKT